MGRWTRCRWLAGTLSKAGRNGSRRLGADGVRSVALMHYRNNEVAKMIGGNFLRVLSAAQGG